MAAKLTARRKVIASLKERLAKIEGVASAWLDDLEQEIYVFVEATKTDNKTLHPIFDAQFEIEEIFPSISFHFR